MVLKNTLQTLMQAIPDTNSITDIDQLGALKDAAAIILFMVLIKEKYGFDLSMASDALDPSVNEYLAKFENIPLPSIDVTAFDISDGLGGFYERVLDLKLKPDLILEDKDTYTDRRKSGRQTTLFETISPELEQASSAVAEPRREKAIQRYGKEMFGKAVLKDAIQILPSLPDSESLDEIRSFLRAKLHFSAEQTRQRYANYIIRRMFPNGYADAPLRLFAKAFPDAQELRDVCFYRFLQNEPLEVEIIEDLILPNLGAGRLSRERIRKRLAEKFPEAKSIVDCGKAIVDALTAGGIVKADRTKISFAYREIPVASFAFILHSEFPEPGMYDIRKLDENRMIRAMLWNPERLLHALYELRNQGLISKISEIDNIRQFTTKHTLAGVVEQIVSGGKKV